MNVRDAQAKRFFDLGKWVGFTAMWLGVAGFFFDMCNDKGLVRQHLPAVWVIGLMVVGVLVGSVARGLGVVRGLHNSGPAA
jgi:hypothetical protein